MMQPDDLPTFLGYGLSQMVYAETAYFSENDKGIIMEFSSPSTSKIYSGRVADSAWKEWISSHVNPADKSVLDIGCGGGIYTHAFHELGASAVIGIDSSEQYVKEAGESLSAVDTLSFLHANATGINLADNYSGIIFQRALIHHLSHDEQSINAKECFRLLTAGGKLIVQDRTLDNVLSREPETWIRNILIEMFPKLVSYEQNRRPVAEEYEAILSKAGFHNIQRHTLVETRKSYASMAALKEEIMQRKGKSILFELSDGELVGYCEALEAMSLDHELVEKDPWTIWIAEK